MQERNTEVESRTACAVFPDRPMAEHAIDDLINAGFARDHISVVMRGREETRRMAEETGTMAGEGAATGVGIGAVVGGGAGILAGLGLLAIPGIGPLLAIGPIVAGISGAVAGGAVGGIAGALIGWGIPEREARAYEDRVKAGGVLVSVRCDGQCDRAMELLQEHGAEMAACTPEGYTPAGYEPQQTYEGRPVVHEPDQAAEFEHLPQEWEKPDRPEDFVPESEYRRDE